MVTTRLATHYDVEELVALFDAYRVFYEKPSDLTGAVKFLTERLIRNDSTIFLAEKNELPVGFVQLYPIFSSTRMKKLWLLNDLFVQPEFRGQGISVKLIEKAKEKARESGSCGLILETTKSNIIGNQLYPKTGFSLDTEHNYYSWNVEPSC
jgi:GNAT superfamily N-acetyltransferase